MGRSMCACKSGPSQFLRALLGALEFGPGLGRPLPILAEGGGNQRIQVDDEVWQILTRAKADQEAAELLSDDPLHGRA
jgi:hypothetical protein